MRILRMVLLVMAVAHLFTGTHNVEAHGVGAVIAIDGGTVTSCFRYASGDVFAYASVLVFAPGGNDVEFQNGRTDRNGCFAFIPDSPGSWSVVAEDGMGHRVEQAVDFELDKAKQERIDVGATARSQATTPRWLAVILGISLILNIFTLPKVLRWKKAH